MLVFVGCEQFPPWFENNFGILRVHHLQNGTPGWRKTCSMCWGSLEKASGEDKIEDEDENQDECENQDDKDEHEHENEHDHHDVDDDDDDEEEISWVHLFWRSQTTTLPLPYQSLHSCQSSECGMANRQCLDDKMSHLNLVEVPPPADCLIGILIMVYCNSHIFG